MKRRMKHWWYIAKEYTVPIIWSVLLLASLWLTWAVSPWWSLLTAWSFNAGYTNYRRVRRLNKNLVYLGWKFQKAIREISGQPPISFQEHVAQVQAKLDKAEANIASDDYAMSYERVDEIPLDKSSSVSEEKDRDALRKFILTPRKGE